MQNYYFFFKKFEILKSKISPKIPSFTISLFLAFLTSFFLFHLSKIVKKLWNFLQCFILRIIDFMNEFLKFLEALFKKYRYVKYFFFQNSAVYYLLFFIIFDIFFSFLPVYSYPKILKLFLLFSCMDQRFYQRILQNYGFFFQGTLIYLKSKISPKSIVYYFFFIFLTFLTSFFSISLIQSCQKIMEFLEVLSIGRIRDFINEF